MTISALFSYAHFVAVFGIFATVFAERLLLSPAPTVAQAKQMQACDRWYGIFAVIVLIVGFLRVVYFEKGLAFYEPNPFFRLKIALFIVVGLLSIYPTMRFIQWGKQTRLGQAPVVTPDEYSRLRRVLTFELVLLLVVALCATLMARGLSF